MRFRIPLTIAGAAVLATTLLHGMETQGIPDQVRKGSDYLVGNWIGEGTAEDQPATMRLSVRWARGEQHQVYEWSISQRGGETVYGNAVGGLDRGRNQWVEQMMESDGSHWTNRWDPVAGDSVEEVEFHGEQTIRHDGKEIQAKLTVQRKGPDEWHYTVAGTEGKPNILSMAFKRTPEKPDKATAARLEDLAWLIGDWEGEFELPSGFDEVGPAGAKVRSFESWRQGLERSSSS